MDIMNKIIKLFSIILSVLLIFGIFGIVTPIVAQATESESETITTDKTTIQADEDTILGEDISRREEFVKHFILSNGTRKAVSYNQPVHYFVNGEWKDIDNTLVLDESQGLYKNRDSSFNVTFGEDLGADTLFSITHQGYTLSWGYEASVFRRNRVKANKPEKDTVKSEIEQKTKNVVDKLEYNEFESNCDLEYVVTGNGVKENIILNSKNATNEFTFTVTTSGLALIKNSDGSLSAKTTNGSEVFYIPAPYMYDSNNEVSSDVAYTIEKQTTSKYTVTITADKQWLADSNRVYPVTIDPATTTKRDRGYIDTTFIANSSEFAGTPLYDKTMLSIGWDSYEYGNTRTLANFDLPTLNKGDMVVNGTFAIALYHKSFYDTTVPKQQIDAHIITQDWDYSTTTWNNKPSFNSVIIDYDYINPTDVENSTNWKYFDITKAVKLWYEGKLKNNGIMVKQHTETGSYATTCANGYFWSEKYNNQYGAYPFISITYRNNKGLENYWSYSTFSADTAGNAYVNDYSGNLVFALPVMATVSEIMPVSLSAYYNTYCSGIAVSAGKNGSSLTSPGKGWRFNFQQTLLPSSQYNLTGEQAEKYPYVYADGDGTEHYFQKTTDDNGNTIYKDEDGLNITLVVNSNNTYMIKDQKDNKLYFNTQGNLTKTENANGRSVTIAYKSDGKHIDYIADGTNHRLEFTYYKLADGSDNVYVNKITDTANREVIFTISGGYLSKVTYPDGTSTTITYENTEEGLVNQITANDGYALNFDYTSQNTGRRIHKVKEYGNGEEGQFVSFDRTNYNTTTIRSAGTDGIHFLTDETKGDDDILNIYQFDDLGRTVGIQTVTGNENEIGAGSSTYTTTPEDTTTKGIKNKVNKTATLAKTTTNLLREGSLDVLDDNWAIGSTTGVTRTIVASDTESHIGDKSVKITNTTVPNGGYSYIRQYRGGLSTGGTYTLSAYAKVTDLTPTGTDSKKGAFIQVTSYDSNGAAIDTVSSPILDDVTSESINNGWKRLSATIKLLNGATSIRVFLCLRSATGTVYFDSVQLERGSVPSDFNMLENSSFEYYSGNTPSYWTPTGITYSSETGTTTDAQKDGVSSFKFTGTATKAQGVYQIVDVKDNPSDTYIVSGWAAAYAVKPTYHQYAKLEIAIRVDYKLSDGSTVSQYKDSVQFNPTVATWQYASAPVVLAYTGGNANETYTPVSVLIMPRFNYQANYIYFDNLQMIKDVAQTYSYDEDGKLISSTANSEHKADLEYEGNDVKEYTDTLGYKTTFNYNNTHDLLSTISPKGVVTENTYNDAGLVIATEIKTSTSENAAKIKNSTAYTQGNTALGIYFGAHTEKIFDEHGKATTYQYDLKSGTLDKLTDANNVSAYYYYDENRTTLESTRIENSIVDYTYSGKSISKITFRSARDSDLYEKYGFTYNNFGRVLETKVNETVIMTNEYGILNGDLISSTYGNGDKITYAYNSIGGVSGIYHNSGQYPSYTWQYKSDGTPLVHRDGVNGLKYLYNYDSIGRLSGLDILDNTDSSYLGAIQYGYDKRNNLTKISHTIGGRTHSQSYSYSAIPGIDETNEYTKDSLATRYTISPGRYADYSYDGLNRITDRKFVLGTTANPVYIRNHYEYALSSRNTNGSTQYKTTQLLQESIEGFNYRYSYDNVGHITQITRNGANYKAYSYDNLSQLISESNVTTNTFTKNTYDDLGNITEKKIYLGSEAPSTNATPVKKLIYNYGTSGEAGWNNILTGITTKWYIDGVESASDTQSISYDEIGNPTSYMGASITWFGRQLKTYTKNGVTISNAYDADGLRGSKTVNGVKTVYHYVGDKLYYENRGDGATELYYFYDTYGKLSAIRCIIPARSVDSVFYTLTNAHGDVMAIFTSGGSRIAAYDYDAWGNQTCYTVTQNELGQDIYTRVDYADAPNHIVHINSIRYRGYVYDHDLGLYYLQSRYYDPYTGRFLNADGFVTTGQGTLTYNMFVYCSNNPANMEDPCGHCSRFLGFLWKVDCKSSTCPTSKKYIKPAPPVSSIGTYNNKKGESIGNVYVIQPEQLDDMNAAKEKKDIVVIDNRTKDNPSMQVRDSHKISNIDHQAQICQLMLDYNASNPVEPKWNRSVDSMLIEWDAHNDGYSVWFVVGIVKENAKERLAHVDFDNEAEGLEYWDYARK